MAVAAFLGRGAEAEWRTDAGYFQLANELGGALPTGSGIPVFQSEADADGVAGSPYLYLPQASAVTPFAGTDHFIGKTFHALGGTGDASGHSNSVGNTFYAWGSIAQGVSTVYVQEAGQFYSSVDDGAAPESFTGLGVVQNHSWIAVASNGTQANLYKTMVRRFDFMLNRDGRLAVVALNNSIGAVPHLLAPSYHAICAGVRSGNHSTSGTLSDQDGPGRMKPDLVVDQDVTSRAAPAIASAAAVLYDAIQPSHPEGDHPQVVKALLLAGASKKNLPAWQRDASAEPFDDVFGAGELNVRNAYYILAAGRRAFSDSAEAGTTGWDFSAASNTTPRRYFFTVPADRFANMFSAAITWHRIVTKVGPSYTSSVPNLTLKLFASVNFVPDAVPIDQSSSSVDNVEHVFLRNLPPGQYLLEVTSDTNNHSYALAWDAQLGPGPALDSRRDANGNVFVDCANLDPFATYTVQTSPGMGSWTNAGTFRTADTAPSTTHSWHDTAQPYPGVRFYRLRWTAVR